jgi:hypothetical protein
MTRPEAKDDKGEPAALADLVGHDPAMADALSTLTKDLAPGEDALFVRFDPNQAEQQPASEYDTDKMPIYSPPSALPHRSPVKTFEMETVKVDPEADARRATTQRNMRGPKRAPEAPPDKSGATRDRKVRAVAVALFGVAVVLVWAIVAVLANQRPEPESTEPVVTAVPVPVAAQRPPEPPAVAVQPEARPEPSVAVVPPVVTPPAVTPPPAPPLKAAPAAAPVPKKPKPAAEPARGAEPPHPRPEF